MSYYQTLQVKHDASQAEVAAAYRRLARRFHPDLNAAPDAHRQMQTINEAYNILRHPERRRRYDATLAPPVSAAQASPPHPARTATATASTPGSPGSAASAGFTAAANRPRPSAAWLSYQKRIGAEIVFTIGHADAMAVLLADLQRRIPPAGRRYNIAHNRWHVAADYEDVLRTLFRNYAPVVQTAASTYAPGRPPSVAARRAPSPDTRTRRVSDRRAWGGMGLAVAAALMVYALIFSRVVLPDVTAAPAEATRVTPASRVARDAANLSGDAAAQDDAIVFPGDCTSAQIATAPTYFQEACKTLQDRPRAATPSPSRQFALTTTRVASNIRSGPDTRFPVLTTAPPGTRLQLVGYTVSRNYVWYITNFGGWIRSDLLTDAPEFLPMVGM
ncbi:DnaJ domain-containing protein [Caldilinea sp.]|uniref:DnaJ domain-containing protein n=1 Tax=Caldilinea sp. TaxID=2293560 RepID=UPI002CCE2222|nr:DnaJ domain-containing protein [Anaerolineales bacterium]HQY90152.1 DnaJ domain-containing protein [Caldilinea sp.]HRA66248.1 DnaJ domain-containing protein [Caldilinea sp.]